MAISELLDCEQPLVRDLRAQTREAFEAGVEALASNARPTAQSAFQQVLSLDPDDVAARHLLGQCG